MQSNWNMNSYPSVLDSYPMILKKLDIFDCNMYQVYDLKMLFMATLIHHYYGVPYRAKS